MRTRRIFVLDLDHQRRKFTRWLFSTLHQPRLRAIFGKEDESGRREESERWEREKEKEEKRFLVTPWELETAAAQPPVAIAEPLFCRVVALSDGSV